MNTIPAPTLVKVGNRFYTVHADGWCPELGCYVFRDEDTGRVTTVPVDR